jgi:putative peptidoglycan lipid II flippase
MVKKAISNIGRMMTKKQTEIMSVATMLMVIGIITKVFGLFSNSVATGYLGTEIFNNFLTASILPELISQIILFGGVSASVLPVLSGVLDKSGEKRFAKVFSTLVNASLIIFIILAIVIALTADFWFVEFFAKGHVYSIEEKAQLVGMLRIMMIPQIILAISVYLTTVLNIYERFLVPQLAPLFYNLGRILSVFVLLPLLGQSPWVLVWGTMIGAILHLAIQIPVLMHLGVKYQVAIDLKDRYISKIAWIIAPRIFSISVEQIAVAIDKIIANSIRVGDPLSFYQLGVQIVSIPLSLFGASFATASFPAMSKAFNNGDRILASQIFIRIINQILFFSIPFSLMLLIFRVPLTRLAYGIFGSEIGFFETYSIAWVVLFFAFGVVFESLRAFLYRTFYANHDTVRPLVMSLVVMALGVVTGIMFTNYFSHYDTFAINDLTFNLDYFFHRGNGYSAVAGLAASSSLIFTLEAFLLIYWLNKKYILASFEDYFKPIMRKVIAGAVMFAVTYVIFRIWASTQMSQKTLFLLILTATNGAAGLMVYLGTSWFLKVSEVNTYISFLLKFPNFQAMKTFLGFNPIPKEE